MSYDTETNQSGNRASRRKMAAMERTQPERTRMQKIREIADQQKKARLARIEKRHEENRKRSAARREAAKKTKV